MNKTMRKTALAALFVLACCVAAHGEPPTEYRTVYSAELPTLNYLDSSTTSVIRMSFSTIDGLVEFDRYGLITCPALPLTGPYLTITEPTRFISARE